MRCLLLVYMMATGQQKTNDVHSQTQLSERSRLHYKFSSYGFYSNLMSLTIGEYFCSYHFFFTLYANHITAWADARHTLGGLSWSPSVFEGEQGWSVRPIGTIDVVANERYLMSKVSCASGTHHRHGWRCIFRNTKDIQIVTNKLPLSTRLGRPKNRSFSFPSGILLLYELHTHTLLFQCHS